MAIAVSGKNVKGIGKTRKMGRKGGNKTGISITYRENYIWMAEMCTKKFFE